MDEQNKTQTNDALFQDAPYAKEITALYDAQRQQQLQQLQGAYDQSVQALQQEQAKIAPAYATQANDLAAQYERTRMNNNLQAASRGLNTGAGSQMALAQQGNYLSAYGGLKTQQAQAEQAVQNRLAELEISYKSAVADAIAKNDHERAAALLEEYKRRDEAAKEQERYDTAQALQKAQLLAQYGIFSGYAELYGQDVADAMQQYYDMMYGGGGDYTTTTRTRTRTGGDSSRGSGSTLGALLGPGVFDFENGDAPTDLRGTQSVSGANDIDNVYLSYMDRYGNPADASSALMRDLRNTAYGQAQIEAMQKGLKPGGAGYNKFVSERSRELLDSNQDYLYVSGIHDEASSLKKEKDAAEATVKQRESYAPYNQDWDTFMREALGMPSNYSDLSSLRGVNASTGQDVEVYNAETGKTKNVHVDTTKRKQTLDKNQKDGGKKTQQIKKQNK